MSKRTRTGNLLVAVAYVRVSKDDQKLGPEAQRAAVEAWAAREGVHVAAYFVDQGVCSVTPVDERPALCAALAALREHGAGVMVVAKRDRIARDVVLAAGVERAAASAGARVVSASGEGNGDGPADAFMRNVIDSAAAYERAMIRARTKAALQAKRAKGEKTGGDAPYGYAVAADGVHLVPVEGEQATIARACQLAAEGHTLRSVATRLAAEGRISRRGRPFFAAQVSRMLADDSADAAA